MYNRFKVTQKQKSIIEIQKTEVERQREYAEEQQYIAEQQKHLVEEKNKEILDSINYAKRIQEAILPSKDSLVENLKNGFVLYKPKDIVAGDFYWLERVGDMVYFAAADCTGHGVPGALVSVVCSNALTKALLEEEISESGKILDRARELVIEKFSKSGSDVKDGMDISLCRLDIKNLKLQWSGANNPLWIVRKSKNNIANGSPEASVELLETKPDKQPIGKYAEAKPFTTHNLDLDSGDCIYIFTDGYSDQFGGNDGKKFKAASLKKLLLSLQDQSMDEQKTIIHQTFEDWRGTLEQVDDVCVIGVKI
jgi:serine phosphatase RsbU (regulator of sigma subunit)